MQLERLLFIYFTRGFYQTERSGNFITYYRKSYYTGLDSYRLGKLSFLLLQLFSLVFMHYNYNAGFIVLNISSLSYFIFHMFHFEKIICKHQAELTKNHKVRIKYYKIVLLLYTIYTVGLVIRIVILPRGLSVLWWVTAVSIMAYSEAITISSAVAFGKKGYVSGDYHVSYDDIDRVCEEKSMNSSGGKILLVSIWRNNKKIGFDKMFIDEYHKLRLHIYQR